MEKQNQYVLIDNIQCYAPELALENNDYPTEAFSILYELEKDNFWFNSRNRVIKNIVGNSMSNTNTSFLEIGCGTGYVLNNLFNNFPNMTFCGSEIYLEGIRFAKKRVPTSEIIQLDATKITFEDKYNGIGAFDVLEHIEDDIAVMKGVYKALKKDGRFFISVPQHQFMWSINDDIAFHKRRYSRKEIIEKLSHSGFEIEYITSFVCTLFPFMMASRFVKKYKKEEITREIIIREVKNLRVGSLINSIFSAMMKIDEFFINKKKSLPFGGSLIVVAKKKS